jgi:serine/threonine protein kinase
MPELREIGSNAKISSYPFTFNNIQCLAKVANYNTITSSDCIIVELAITIYINYVMDVGEDGAHSMELLAYGRVFEDYGTENIIPFETDQQHENHEICLILRYIENGTVDAITQPLPNMAGELQRFLSFLCTTCKKHGFSHNDLHGENVMLDKNNRLKIIDFGRADFTSATSRINDISKKLLNTFYSPPRVVLDTAYKTLRELTNSRYYTNALNFQLSPATTPKVAAKLRADMGYMIDLMTISMNIFMKLAALNKQRGFNPYANGLLSIMFQTQDINRVELYSFDPAGVVDYSKVNNPEESN